MQKDVPPYPSPPIGPDPPRRREEGGANILVWGSAAYFVAAPFITLGPFDSYLAVNSVKGIGLICVVLLAGLYGSRIPTRAGISLMALVLLGAFGTIPFLWTADTGRWFRALFELGAPALMFALGLRTGSRIGAKVLTRTALVTSLVAVLMVGQALADLQVEGRVAGIVDILGSATVRRTAWSTNTTMILVAFVVSRIGARSSSVWKLLLPVATVLLSQLMLGGRAGVIIVLAVLGAVAVSHRSKAILAALATVITVASALAAWFGLDVLTHFRLRSNAVGLYGAIDDIAAGRLSLTLEAIRSLRSAGLAGSPDPLLFGNYEVHVVWLRILLEFGLVYLIAALGLLVLAARALYREGESFIPYRSRKWLLVALVALSLLEPSFPFGTLNLAALTWFVLGVSSPSPRVLLTPDMSPRSALAAAHLTGSRSAG